MSKSSRSPRPPGVRKGGSLERVLNGKEGAAKRGAASENETGGEAWREAERKMEAKMGPVTVLVGEPAKTPRHSGRL